MYDINQSIYIFRNKVVTVPVSSDPTLSQTFRFGKNIAYFANWVILIIQYIRVGNHIREPTETDSTFIRRNNEINDVVISYEDDWTDNIFGRVVTQVDMIDYGYVFDTRYFNPLTVAIKLLKGKWWKYKA